ncbi:MAG: small conductance mechanosensitive ion channel (MscS) family protein [uncultured bacterium]|nr:MAG: small conductance mechanosensitive ion channel (MscS) family protein [uncultured bacterium]
MTHFFNYMLLGNQISIWIFFIICLFGGCFVIKIAGNKSIEFIKYILKKLKIFPVDPVITFIEGYAIFFIYGIVIYLTLGFLELSPLFQKIYNMFGNILFVGSLTLLFTETTDWFLKNSMQKQETKPIIKTALPGFSKIAKIMIWVIAAIFFMENLGFRISTLVAGLGIGGIAIAFASQIILKDLFSYVSILLDQPFAVGDFLIVGEFMGTIEHIGIKTTRVRSLSGEILIFSNTDLTESRLRNYQHMKERRVLFSIGVIYNTPLEQLKKISSIIQTIINNIENTRFDRAHFFKYGDSGLIYEIVYYVIGSEYNKYMDIQQLINLGIKAEFEKRKIEFAYPTQTLHIEKKNLN